jgi:hypothetical protein
VQDAERIADRVLIATLDAVRTRRKEPLLELKVWASVAQVVATKMADCARSLGDAAQAIAAAGVHDEPDSLHRDALSKGFVHNTGQARQAAEMAEGGAITSSRCAIDIGDAFLDEVSFGPAERIPTAPASPETAPLPDDVLDPVPGIPDTLIPSPPKRAKAPEAPKAPKAPKRVPRRHRLDDEEEEEDPIEDFSDEEGK